MKKLDFYYTERPISDDIRDLSDPGLSYEADRSEVNELILNTIIKYLAVYLEIAETDIYKIRTSIFRLIEESKRDDHSFNPYLSGQAVENIWGMKPGVDYFPLSCAGDIRRTAAIFKEIAFNDRFKADGKFRGVDLGSGIGVLTLAMVIAAQRKGIKDIMCIGVDVRERAAVKSRKALKSTIGEKAKVIHADLLKDSLLQNIIRGLKPNYWVSETISSTAEYSTPELDFQKPDFGLSDPEKIRRRKERHHDPFVEFVSETVQAMPDFLDKVQRKEIAMFPDIANGLYVPNKQNSIMHLLTGPTRPLLLHHTGEEFKYYEDLVNVSRWPEISVSESPELKINFREATKPKDKTAEPADQDDTGQLSQFDEI